MFLVSALAAEWIEMMNWTRSAFFDFVSALAAEWIEMQVWVCPA